MNALKLGRPTLAEWSEQIRLRIKCCPSKERDNIKTIMRRVDHLASRVANGPRRTCDYDLREMSALTWAIDVITSRTSPNPRD